MPWRVGESMKSVLGRFNLTQDLLEIDFIPGLGRSTGEGIGYPLQYSWASLVAQMVKNLPTVHGVTKNWTLLSNFNFPFLTELPWCQSQFFPAVLFPCAWSPSCVFMTPRTVARQAPLSMALLQARVLEWVAVSFSRGSSWPRDPTCISCIGRQILYHWATWEALFAPVASYLKQNEEETYWGIFHEIIKKCKHFYGGLKS